MGHLLAKTLIFSNFHYFLKVASQRSRYFARQNSIMVIPMLERALFTASPTQSTESSRPQPVSRILAPPRLLLELSASSPPPRCASFSLSIICPNRHPHCHRSRTVFSPCQLLVTMWAGPMGSPCPSRRLSVDRGRAAEGLPNLWCARSLANKGRTSLEMVTQQKCHIQLVILLIWVLNCRSFSSLMKIWLSLMKVSLVSYLLLRRMQIRLPPMWDEVTSWCSESNLL
jgi:hypothetical protein